MGLSRALGAVVLLEYPVGVNPTIPTTASPEAAVGATVLGLALTPGRRRVATGALPEKQQNRGTQC